MDWTKALPAVVGTLGFLLSLFNFWRAAKTANELRSIAYAQKKHDLLAAILNAEASYLSVKVQAQDILYEAADAKASEAEHAAEQANFVLSQCEEALKILEESRSALNAASSRDKNHNDLVYLVEEHASAVNEFTNKSKIEAEAAAVLQPAKRLLRVIARRKNPDA